LEVDELPMGTPAEDAQGDVTRRDFCDGDVGVDRIALWCGLRHRADLVCLLFQPTFNLRRERRELLCRCLLLLSPLLSIRCLVNHIPDVQNVLLVRVCLLQCVFEHLDGEPDSDTYSEAFREGTR
jgi:hypothetical protein